MQATLAPSAEPTFRCRKCQMDHPWAAEYSGKTARCTCGNVLKVPSTPERGMALPAAAGLPPPPIAQRAPSSDTNNAPPALPPALPGTGGSLIASLKSFPADSELDADVEHELEDLAQYGEIDRTKPDPKRDVYAPTILLTIGALLVLLQIAYAAAHGHSVGSAVGEAILDIIVGVALMLVGVLFAAKVTGVSFGDARLAMVKLVALYIGPTSLGVLVTALLGGDIAVAMIGWGVSGILYWSLLSYMFRLDGNQTATCVFGVFLARTVWVWLIKPILMVSLFVASGAADGDTDSGVIDDGPDEDLAAVQLDE
jgi:hypothetical protein